ncbi:MAG: flippase [Candidatus Daviesbacteria bacterium]|nr:flippase [Candidatus Daviesbacteria bacterium]
MEKILRQTSWLFLSQVITRTIGFFYTIFLAKNLGVSDYGLFSIALVYFSLLSTIADFGFNRFLVTEIASDRKKTSQLLFATAIFRLAITSILYAIFAVGLYFLDPDKIRVYLILLASLAVLPQSIALTLDAVFIAIQKLQISSIALLSLSISTTIGGIILVNLKYGVTGAIIAVILGQLIYLSTLAFFLKVQHIALQLEVKWQTLKNIIWGSVPYGLVGILGLLYFKIDALMLGYLKGNFDVGIYSVAFRFLEAIIFIPTSLSTALFPNIVRLIHTDTAKAYKLYINATLILLFASLIIFIIYQTLVPLVISNFLPQYLPSINVIRILAFTIPFMFMISPQGIILYSEKRFLRALILISVFNLVLNIGLNFYLIPKYSYFGSAWATLISDIVGFFIFFVYIRSKLIKGLK